MSKELEVRNRAMFHMYASGRSTQEVADHYGVSRQRASQIIAREAQNDSLSDDESRFLAYTQLEWLEQKMLEIVDAGAPPSYDVKGNMLVDENGEPVRNQEDVIKAADQYRKLSDSKRRLVALDKPRRKQIDEDVAMRMAREWLAGLPQGQVELSVIACTAVFAAVQDVRGGVLQLPFMQWRVFRFPVAKRLRHYFSLIVVRQVGHFGGEGFDMVLPLLEHAELRHTHCGRVQCTWQLLPCFPQCLPL